MVFGLFSKESKLQRTIKKATNKMAQSPDRWAAMDKLREDGSEEALFHLLRRFTFSYSKMVEDEQEKEWVVEVMVAKGEQGLPALRRFMKSAPVVAYPLRILEKVTSRERTLELVDELLADEDPGYTRDTTKRIQILDWLREWKDAGAADAVQANREIVQRAAPYLRDFDENTRFAAAEALGQHACAEAAEPLVSALIDEDEQSGRLKVRIAEILADHDLSLCGHTQEVSALLDSTLADFRIHKDKLARKSD